MQLEFFRVYRAALVFGFAGGFYPDWEEGRGLRVGYVSSPGCVLGIGGGVGDDAEEAEGDGVVWEGSGEGEEEFAREEAEEGEVRVGEGQRPLGGIGLVEEFGGEEPGLGGEHDGEGGWWVHCVVVQCPVSSVVNEETRTNVRTLNRIHGKGLPGCQAETFLS